MLFITMVHGGNELRQLKQKARSMWLWRHNVREAQKGKQMSQRLRKRRRRLLFLCNSPGSTPARVGGEKKNNKKKKQQFNLKVVQGKWTRELSCWNLIKDPPNYYYLPSRKVKWLHQPKDLREGSRISNPEGEGLQIFQILSLKLLEVIFFF